MLVNTLVTNDNHTKRSPSSGLSNVKHVNKPMGERECFLPCNANHPYSAHKKVKKKPPHWEDMGRLEKNKTLAVTYSRMQVHTTIGAAAFHFRVRDGIGWFHNAIAARERVEEAHLTRITPKGKE